MIVALNGESQWIFSSAYRKSVKTQIMDKFLKIPDFCNPKLFLKYRNFIQYFFFWGGGGSELNFVKTSSVENCQTIPFPTQIKHDDQITIKQQRKDK
jgi:hypothetical protein